MTAQHTHSKIADAILSQFPEGIDFKPQKSFYESVKINKHRFAKIYRGETVPTLKEASAIASHFKFSITELI
ncbi:hypothetical protein [Larkinella rosea]|uniref:XRE family transcriptional regulator n=1 Tax=Larkinella rosea TaxID=2025312 RepID=A0A3P1BS34_9BACT|nr:hypothetical protein [Larkinella rosea]RRB03900.1 hypothetical protein EHT25_10215 [Larkinella rosea]